jgi:molybdenum cofactor cytidylyltransferase
LNAPVPGGAPIVGILLAAGSASRFGGGKLLATLHDGIPVGVAALRNLLAAVDVAIAVVRPADDALAETLRAEGARVTVCPDARDGMGASLAWAVRAAPMAAGWIVALADMPWIQPASIRSVVSLLRRHALLAAPQYHGQRGHPVGIAARLYSDLTRLHADEGARRLLAEHSGEIEFVPVSDAGVLRDVDTPADLP